jgi:hypothetical protein
VSIRNRAVKEMLAKRSGVPSPSDPCPPVRPLSVKPRVPVLIDVKRKPEVA